MWLALLAVLAGTMHSADVRATAPAAVRMSIPVERLEGAQLLAFSLRMGALDTSGCALLDTGAGFFVLERSLAARLGHAADTTGGLAVLPAPITGVRFGSAGELSAYPAIALDLSGVRAAIDRNVLALAGAALFREQALIVDPRRDRVELVPSPRVADSSSAVRIDQSRDRLRDELDPRAIPVPFELRADDKIVVRATLDRRTPLCLVLDTGATKLALFGETLRRAGARRPSTRSLRGLSAPTLYGDATVDFVRVSELTLDDARPPWTERDLDAAWLDSPLADALGRTVGEPVHGLLGDSFLRRFRYVVDYGSRVLWLERLDVGRDQRENEYCTIGVQLHRPEGRTRVAAVARATPAARAGIRAGDELVSVDGLSSSHATLVDVVRALEGEPGTSVRVEWRRGTRLWRKVIQRERLL